MAERRLTKDACPVCGSTSIEGWEVTIEGSLAIQECTCGEGGVSWNDVYKLRGRIVLEELRPCVDACLAHGVNGLARLTNED